MDELSFELQKLNHLKNIERNLTNGVPILIGYDAINLVQLYIKDLEKMIGNISIGTIQ